MKFIENRFKKLPVTVDLPRLQIEADKLLWQPEHNWYKDQISLQTNGDANWESSIGSKKGENELQWDKLHPDLIGTWWEEFFTNLPFKLYRARLMTMHPRTCYSIHVDDTPRIHIAIKTHKQARFIFTNPPVLKHIPADGHLWWVDTREEHTALNGSLEARIHLVAVLVNSTVD